MILKNEEQLAKANLSNSQLHEDIVFEFEVNMPNLMICTTGNVYFKTHAIVKSIEAGGSIEAWGFIEAWGSIEAGGSIEAWGFIDADRFIKTGGFIKTKGFIKARGSIEARRFIKAGGSIEAGEFVYSFTFEIACKSLMTRLLPFFRNFYAEMPPLKAYRNSILDTSKCWSDLRKEIAPNANEVCAWEGWHPIVKAQLKMFFGLKKSVTFD